ncbi:CCA tRNA nucleotidyltransferase [Streptococcus dentiloxodontae]
MRLEHLPSEFQKALPILEKIKTAGFEAYFVGGSVRDVLLNRPIHDVDIAASCYPQETKAIFKHTIDIGIEHGTVLVLENGGEYEITTFRTEDVYVDYRRPSSVSFVRSLKEDLKRRDFTVNALALDDSGRIIDLFDGLSDLKQSILRAVGQAEARFHEDALRIMRALRFAASLNFDIEPKTFAAMKAYAPLLEKISIERSFVEFDKLLMSPHWRKGIQAFMAIRAYDYLPDFQDTFDKWQCLLADYTENFSFSSSEQAWAAVLLSQHHKNPKTFFKKWKTSTNFQRAVEAIMIIFEQRLADDVTKQMIYTYGKDWILLAEELRQAQGLSVDFERIERLDTELTIHDKHEIAINGGMLIKDLGFKPGPEMGKVLKAVEEAIVLGTLANEREAIFEFIKEIGHV